MRRFAFWKAALTPHCFYRHRHAWEHGRHEARSVHPRPLAAVEIILTSGHVAAKDVRIPERGLFFTKPYDPQMVSQAMRRMARNIVNR